MSELLTKPYATMRVLDQFGIRAKKKYGQNFLIDEGIVNGIVEAAGVTKEDCVLEIGPGIGTMTQALSAAAGHVVAVEIDTSLEPVLAVTLDGNESYCMCVANLPYYITTPILLQLLKQKNCFDNITVMIQKEVAERICATQENREYGALSLAVQYYARPEAVLTVPPRCFIPRPGVDSQVLRLNAFAEPPVDADEEFMFAIIRAAFNQRRKTLANALSHGLSYEGRTYTREAVENALSGLSLDKAVRGEKLSLAQFAALSKALKVC